jgi:hypothetical protein
MILTLEALAGEQGALGREEEHRFKSRPGDTIAHHC